MPTAGDPIMSSDVQDVIDDMANALTDYAVGAVSITPVANTPTSTTWTYGKTLPTNVRVFATAVSTVIGSAVMGVSSSGSTTTSALIYVYRTNTTATSVHVLAIGGAP